MPPWVVCDRDIVDVVFPQLNAVLVERVEREGDAVRVVARSRGEPVPCPSCGTPTGKVHGYYRRHLADSPAGGAPVVLELARGGFLHAAAHITGGGFVENVPRALPEGLGAEIDRGAWAVPPIFDLVQGETGATDEEMYETFNMGIGMVLVAPPEAADRIEGPVIGGVGPGAGVDIH